MLLGQHVAKKYADNETPFLQGSDLVYLRYNTKVGNGQRLRWSRGNVLAFGTQVRGFKPGRSRRIFQGEKILSTPSFGGEVKRRSHVVDLRHVKDS